MKFNNKLKTVLYRFISLSAEHTVILILLLVLSAKYIFFENGEEIVERIQTESPKEVEDNNSLQLNRKSSKFFYIDDDNSGK